MGGLNFGPNLNKLLIQLADKGNLTTFVETGTLRGETSRWAASHFDKVITIELDENLHETARKRSTAENIKFIHGRSQEELGPVVESIPSSIMFYLDAHCGFAKEQADEGFSVEGSDKQEEPLNPLLEELTTLKRSLAHPLNHVIVIDDAVRFLRPPPPPFPPGAIPSIQEVISGIEAISKEYYIVIFEGHVIAVPPQLKQSTRDQIREYMAPNQRSFSQKILLKLWQDILFPTGRKIYRAIG